ncbi:hypothetical protein FB451DRAFT_1164530 [Mycena latifolia]|nr:hypothetical protein FB451DRAFT_1164530 [Mycena latifolia]
MAYVRVLGSHTLHLICNTYVTGRKKLVEMAQQQKKKREHVHSRSLALCTTRRVPSPDDVQVTGQPDDFMDVDTGHMNMDIDEYAPDAPATVPLPPRFIYVKHHPHAEKFPEFIPLDCGVLNPQSALTPDTKLVPLHDERPFKPFLSFADYKFASKCVRRRMPNAQIDEDLHEMHGHIYSSDCHVSFKTHRDLNQSLAAARVSNIAFHSETLTIDFNGRHFRGLFEVDIEFRDPWRIMKDWVCDPTLAPVSTWFSQEKFLCSRGTIEYSNPLYDEPWTGKTWREVDNGLPSGGKYPSCFLGLHVWLDKGLVSTKVKMHPILFRACWIHSTTRNASGNGGSTLAGFVRMPDALRHVDPKTLKSSERAEYDRLKRIIYREVCHLVLAALKKRSHNGEAVKFGDGIIHIGYPGVLIESMDFEELAAWLAIRNSRSLHPCPRCLVHKDDLHRLTRIFTNRTSESMSRALAQAPKNPKADRNEHLKQYGLHDFEHFLWEFSNSDPYKAASYDCLHFFDGGIWGRHLWVVIKEYLQNNGLASDFNQHMSQFPRWRNLKHIQSPTTIEYSEGQTFLDILKCALPCLVQLLPPNSCLVRVVRVMQKICVLLGLEVHTNTRLERLHEAIGEYEKICEEISRKHGKVFDFLKQHFLGHAIDAFKSKGTSRNMNTRVGEGFQQEVATLYKKTNGKNAEHQISVMDENEETMARLDMLVNLWRRSQEEDDELDLMQPAMDSTAHWRLGSPDSQVLSHRLDISRDPLFHDFNFRLREYLAHHHGSHLVSPQDDIKIEPCKVLYIEYQSMVDWRCERDILRCNPSFHGLPRYNSVIFSAEDDLLAVGQIEYLFRCHLPHRVPLDLAMIRPYCVSTWKPRTCTDCPIREKGSRPVFISLEHITRGALLSPIFGAPREVFYVVDCVDEDMYLRINRIE